MHNWPTREEWAKRRRAPYFDSLSDLEVSRRLSDYATSEEAEAAIAALEVLYKEKGRAMKAAKLAAGSLAQQPGETPTTFTRRWIAMPRAEQELATEPDCLRIDRQAIREAIKVLREDVLPMGWRGGSHLGSEAEAILAPIRVRYDAAYKRAEDAEITRIESLPIDDGAWEEELRRRAEIEEMGRPENCIHIAGR